MRQKLLALLIHLTCKSTRNPIKPRMSQRISTIIADEITPTTVQIRYEVAMSLAFGAPHHNTFTTDSWKVLLQQDHHFLLHCAWQEVAKTINRVSKRSHYRQDIGENPISRLIGKIYKFTGLKGWIYQVIWLKLGLDEQRCKRYLFNFTITNYSFLPL
jgi:hypothetical protein